jgi:hypothetical protein
LLQVFILAFSAFASDKALGMDLRCDHLLALFVLSAADENRTGGWCQLTRVENIILSC